MKVKKFIEYIAEQKEKDKKDLEDAQPPKPAEDPSLVMKCPKCGNTEKVCKCFTQDYYNAKTPQTTPKPQKKSKK